MTFDDLLRQIGQFGPYQRQVYFLAVAPVILIGFETMSQIFIFYVPPHRCAIPGYPGDTYKIQNEKHSLAINMSIPLTNGEWDRCHVYGNVTADVIAGGDAIPADASRRQCNKWVYEQSTFETTLTTTFNVVCDRRLKRYASNVFSELGAMIGACLFGFLADRFGRKVTFCFAGLVVIGGGSGLAFAHSLEAVNLCHLLLGLSRMVIWSNGLIIGLEIVGPSWRTFAGLFVALVWVVGSLLVLLFFYVVRHWRFVGVAVSVPAMSLFFCWWLLPESPRWLASRGRKKECLEVLRTIARSNKTQLPSGDNSFILGSQEKRGFSYVFWSPELRKRMVIVFTNMFVVVLAYYGLTLNITNLSGNLFHNAATNIVSEMLAYITPYFLLQRVGRKPVYCGSLFLGGMLCVVSIAPVFTGCKSGMAVTSLALTGRFFMSVAFATLYIYACELFPTVVRSSVMGVGITFSRMANAVAPFMSEIGRTVGGEFESAFPLLLMGFPAVLVGVLTLWLPESLHATMPETIDDVENYREGFHSITSDTGRTTEKDIIEVKPEREQPSVSNNHETGQAAVASAQI